jgi:hypothetical protein
MGDDGDFSQKVVELICSDEAVKVFYISARAIA